MQLFGIPRFLATLAFFPLTLFAGNSGDEKPVVTRAPSGRYSIIQRVDKYNSTYDSASPTVWSAVVHFADKTIPDATLAAYPEEYNAPADYSISPDERWIIRHQHLGGGVGDLFLYRVDENGQIWRLQESLISLALDAVFARLHTSLDNYRKASGKFESWDIPAGLIHLSVWGMPKDGTRGPVGYVGYDFKKHRTVIEKITYEEL
jgi:hypothetical protein